MKKIKKIKIRLNGKEKQIAKDFKIEKLINDLKIPIKKVAIELNQEILDKKKLNKIKLKKDDKTNLSVLLRDLKVPLRKVAI